MTKRIEDENWSGVRFKNINFAGAKVIEGYFENADLNGYIGGLKVSGVEVGPLIEAEMTRRYPDRAKLHPLDLDGCRQTLAMIRDQLDATWERARALTEEQRREQVDEEWSVVETVQHLVFVLDGWVSGIIRGESDPYHPIGMPPSFLPRKPEGTSVDPDASPTFEEAVEVLNGRLHAFDRYLAELTIEGVQRPIDHPHAKSVHEALWVVFDELWSHNRYANRDLTTIESATT